MYNSIVIFVLAVILGSECGIILESKMKDAMNEFNNNVINYDKSLPPKTDDSGPVKVNVTLYAIDMEYCPESKELSIDMYFRQKWIDKRLEMETNKISVTGGQSLYEKLWIPDTFFASVSSVKTMKYPTHNIFAKISPDGQVYYSQRFQTMIRCGETETHNEGNPELVFKQVRCLLEIESYGYSTADIVYSWDKGQESIGVSEYLRDTKYRLAEHKAVHKLEELSTGNYSRLIGEFVLVPQSHNEIRHVGF